MPLLRPPKLAPLAVVVVVGLKVEVVVEAQNAVLEALVGLE
jgi:hypothetical protein